MIEISCLQFSKSVWELTNILFRAKILFLEVSRTRNTNENPPEKYDLLSKIDGLSLPKTIKNPCVSYSLSYYVVIWHKTNLLKGFKCSSEKSIELIKWK